MKSINYIVDALINIENEVKELFLDTKIEMKKKDALMLSLMQQRSVLEQTLQDLHYLKENPPAVDDGCKMKNYRE